MLGKARSQDARAAHAVVLRVPALDVGRESTTCSRLRKPLGNNTVGMIAMLICTRGIAWTITSRDDTNEQRPKRVGLRRVIDTTLHRGSRTASRGFSASWTFGHPLTTKAKSCACKISSPASIDLATERSKGTISCATDSCSCSCPAVHNM